MKQHITVEQWNELTEEQKLIIHRFFGHDNVTQLSVWHDSSEDLLRYFAMGIGHMIEFIIEHTGYQEIDIRMHKKDKNKSSWPKHGILFDVFLDGWDIEEDNEELCDALWSVILDMMYGRIKKVDINI